MSIQLVSPLTQAQAEQWINENKAVFGVVDVENVEIVINQHHEFINHAISELSDGEKDRFLRILKSDLSAAPKMISFADLKEKNPNVRVSSPVSTISANTESHNVGMIGTVIIALSVISTVITLLMFGRIEVISGSYYKYTETVWSPTIVVIIVCLGLSGVLLGYLFQKIGSVLKHLEELNKNK